MHEKRREKNKEICNRQNGNRIRSLSPDKLNICKISIVYIRPLPFAIQNKQFRHFSPLLHCSFFSIVFTSARSTRCITNNYFSLNVFCLVWFGFGCVRRVKKLYNAYKYVFLFKQKLIYYMVVDDENIHKYANAFI